MSPIRSFLASLWELDDQYPVQEIHFNKDDSTLIITVSPKTFAEIDTDYLVGAKVTENKISYLGSCDIEIIKSEHKDFNMTDYWNKILGQVSYR